MTKDFLYAYFIGWFVLFVFWLIVLIFIFIRKPIKSKLTMKLTFISLLAFGIIFLFLLNLSVNDSI